jgi:hypothetical protein
MPWEEVSFNDSSVTEYEWETSRSGGDGAGEVSGDEWQWRMDLEEEDLHWGIGRGPP